MTGCHIPMSVRKGRHGSRPESRKGCEMEVKRGFGKHVGGEGDGLSICFDTETTGFDPTGDDADEILTLSVIGRDGSVLFDGRFRPSHKREWPGASAVNGIYPEDVASLPAIGSAIERLQGIFGAADEVIGYNVGFDLGFLAAVGVRPREGAAIIDTMREYARFIGEWNDKRGDYRWHKLTAAAEHIGYTWTGAAHGSLADAYATLAVQEWLEAQA